MSKQKTSRAKKKSEVSIVRSSAAEYLTFVSAGGQSETSVEMRYEDENVWLTQKMMATLYDVSVPAIYTKILNEGMEPPKGSRTS